MPQIQVFSKDLRAASDISSSTKALSIYEVGELVHLSPSEVGVIIKLEKDLIHILTQYGVVQRVKPQMIRNKRDSNRAVTSDANSQPITKGENIFINEPGSAMKKRGTVLHIYRTYVFYRSQDVGEHGGVAVAKNNHITIVGGRSAPSVAGAGRGAASSYNPYASSTPRTAAPNGAGGAGRGAGGRDPFMQKTVIISGGPYKGYLGIVKDVTDTHARVELHTGNKTISVEKSKLSIAGENGAAMRTTPRSDFADRYDHAGSTGSRTPMHGGARTPMHRASGGGLSGSGSNDGSRTPAWDSGSRTPAWDSGSRTPAWNAGSRTPAWAPGSRTPAWDSGSRTPAAASASSAFGALSAPGSVVGATPVFQGILADTPEPPVHTPATPGLSMPMAEHHAATPAGMMFPATPAAIMVPATPGVMGQYPSMASVPYSALPTTPHVPATPFVPATPAPASAEADYYAAETPAPSGSTEISWLSTDIEVQVIAPREGFMRYRGGQWEGRRGVIRQVESGGRVARVHLVDGSDILTGVPLECLEPVAPEKRAQCKVIRGDYRGSTGNLLSIDGHEGLVRLEPRNEIVMMNLYLLAKYVQPAA
eukprot:jgi/Hompol1/558/HPOL_005353-RA